MPSPLGLVSHHIKQSSFNVQKERYHGFNNPVLSFVAFLACLCWPPKFALEHVQHVQHVQVQCPHSEEDLPESRHKGLPTKTA